MEASIITAIGASAVLPISCINTIVTFTPDSSPSCYVLSCFGRKTSHSPKKNSVEPLDDHKMARGQKRGKKKKSSILKKL